MLDKKMYVIQASMKVLISNLADFIALLDFSRFHFIVPSILSNFDSLMYCPIIECLSEKAKYNEHLNREGGEVLQNVHLSHKYLMADNTL